MLCRSLTTCDAAKGTRGRSEKLCSGVTASFSRALAHRARERSVPHSATPAPRAWSLAPLLLPRAQLGSGWALHCVLATRLPL